MREPQLGQYSEGCAEEGLVAHDESELHAGQEPSVRPAAYCEHPSHEERPASDLAANFAAVLAATEHFAQAAHAPQEAQSEQTAPFFFLKEIIILITINSKTAPTIAVPKKLLIKNLLQTVSIIYFMLRFLYSKFYFMPHFSLSPLKKASKTHFGSPVEELTNSSILIL